MNFMCSSAETIPLVSHDCVTETFADILRKLERGEDGWNDEVLSQASGVSVRSIRSYRTEGKEPGLSKALSLLCALGQSDLNKVLAVIGYVARPLDEADKLPCGEVIARVLANSSTIAHAAADGRIDHIEAPLCRIAADNIVAAVLPMSSAGAAA